MSTSFMVNAYNGYLTRTSISNLIYVIRWCRSKFTQYLLKSYAI